LLNHGNTVDYADVSKPKCESFGEYVIATMTALNKTQQDNSYWRTDNKSNQSEALAECLLQCPRTTCETWNYNLEQNIIQQSPTNLSELWNTRAGDTSITFYVKARNVKVTEEHISYGLNQLIGEIGGTWGFYLGFSLVHILYAFDKIIITLIDKICSAIK
jgi:hypothetical protein